MIKNFILIFLISIFVNSSFADIFDIRKIIGSDSFISWIYKDEDNNCVKLDCNHKFHSHCITEWLHKELTCPNCRVELEL